LSKGGEVWEVEKVTGVAGRRTVLTPKFGNFVANSLWKEADNLMNDEFKIADSRMHDRIWKQIERDYVGRVFSTSIGGAPE
jgi:hypothetical protein